MWPATASDPSGKIWRHRSRLGWPFARRMPHGTSGWCRWQGEHHTARVTMIQLGSVFRRHQPPCFSLSWMPIMDNGMKRMPPTLVSKNRPSKSATAPRTIAMPGRASVVLRRSACAASPSVTLSVWGGQDRRGYRDHDR